MGFLDKIRRLVLRKHNNDDIPYSVVMLLRSPFVMSKEILEAAASKAYRMPYDGSEEMYCVVPSAPLVKGTLLSWMKAGASLITVLEAAEPYLGDPVEVAKGFKNELLESAWIEHRQWVSFDLVNRDVPKKQAYAVLAKLVSELLDARCAGIYLPKENQFTIQDRAAAAEHLSRLAR